MTTQSISGLSFNRRILHAAMIVTFVGVLVKVVATAKEFIVAGVFGRSDEMDAFLIAYLVPGVLMNLFSDSMNQALIPTLVRVKEVDGHCKAQNLLSSALFSTCIFATAGSLLMAVAARVFFPIIFMQFPAHKLLLAEQLFYGLLPIVLLCSVASNCTAVVNTTERFALPALAMVSTPLAIIIAMWLLAPRLGIWSMVFANLTGELLRVVVVVWFMQGHGYRFNLRWHGFSPQFREVVQQYGLVLLSGLVASGGLLVDQGMAATLPSGSVSTLVYANRFVAVVLNLLAGSIGTAITPYFSKLVAQRDWAACRRTVNTYVWITALISIPVALTMIFGSHLLVRLAFQHQAFGLQDTAAVSRVQAMYAIQVPFYIVSRVFYRYLVAIRRTSLTLYCGAISLFLDVIFNLSLMRVYGVAGIALATSLWTIISCGFLAYWTYRLLPVSEPMQSVA